MILLLTNAHGSSKPLDRAAHSAQPVVSMAPPRAQHWRARMDQHRWEKLQHQFESCRPERESSTAACSHSVLLTSSIRLTKTPRWSTAQVMQLVPFP